MSDGSANAPPVDQIAAAVLEAQALASAFTRLECQSPPALAWRCARLGRAISAAVDELFPDPRGRTRTTRRVSVT